MKKSRTLDNSENINGDIRLHIESAVDYIQVNQFCMNLKTITGLKIASYSWSEKKGLIITISLGNPVPLGDLLRRMPLVGEVYKRKKKNITVALNTSVPEMMPEFVPFSEERILV